MKLNAPTITDVNQLEKEKKLRLRQEKKQFIKALSHHLCKLRKDRHLSQVQLSRLVGADKKYINRLEKGRYIPNSYRLWRIAHALDLTLAEFFQDFE